MLKLGLFAAVLVVAGCSKDKPAPAPEKPPATAHTGEHAGDDMAPPEKVELPPAGTAPDPVTVDKELPMWNAPIKTLKGQDMKLADYKGKALMIVNVASKCGNTPQYTALEALQEKYGPKGFTVIGFPCNQFGGQEPGTAEEIQEFCSTTYGVTFPLTEKVEVNGANRHEIYKELTAVPDAKGRTGDIEWNFEKFVVSADGSKITRFTHKTKPNDPAVIAAVEAALPKS